MPVSDRKYVQSVQVIKDKTTEVKLSYQK